MQYLPGTKVLFQEFESVGSVLGKILAYNPPMDGEGLGKLKIEILESSNPDRIGQVTFIDADPENVVRHVMANLNKTAGSGIYVWHDNRENMPSGIEINLPEGSTDEAIAELAESEGLIGCPGHTIIVGRVPNGYMLKDIDTGLVYGILMQKYETEENIDAAGRHRCPNCGKEVETDGLCDNCKPRTKHYTEPPASGHSTYTALMQMIDRVAAHHGMTFKKLAGIEDNKHYDLAIRLIQNIPGFVDKLFEKGELDKFKDSHMNLKDFSAALEPFAARYIQENFRFFPELTQISDIDSMIYIKSAVVGTLRNFVEIKLKSYHAEDPKIDLSNDPFLKSIMDKPEPGNKGNDIEINKFNDLDNKLSDIFMQILKTNSVAELEYLRKKLYEIRKVGLDILDGIKASRPNTDIKLASFKFQETIKKIESTLNEKISSLQLSEVKPSEAKPSEAKPYTEPNKPEFGGHNYSSLKDKVLSIVAKKGYPISDKKINLFASDSKDDYEWLEKNGLYYREVAYPNANNYNSIEYMFYAPGKLSEDEAIAMMHAAGFAPATDPLDYHSSSFATIDDFKYYGQNDVTTWKSTDYHD